METLQFAVSHNLILSFSELGCFKQTSTNVLSSLFNISQVFITPLTFLISNHHHNYPFVLNAIAILLQTGGNHDRCCVGNGACVSELTCTQKLDYGIQIKSSKARQPQELLPAPDRYQHRLLTFL